LSSFKILLQALDFRLDDFQRARRLAVEVAVKRNFVANLGLGIHASGRLIFREARKR
jgi:hypothetical protein